MTSATTFGRRAAPTAAGPSPAARASLEPAAAEKPRWAIESEDIDVLGRIPFVAIGLILLLTLIYLVEQAAGFEPGPAQSHRTLVALGSDSRNLVINHGQWWRPVTSMLLHASWEHLIGNCVALFIAGMMLERRLGRAWFAAIFVIGGLAGSIASLIYNPPDLVCMGASGAIMALLIPSLMEAFGNETVYTLKAPRRWVLFMVVSALVPTGPGIDYVAHAGGALAGGLLGYVLLFAVPELHDWAAGRIAAASIAAAGAAVAVIGFVMTAINYPAYAAADAQLIPDAEVAKLTFKTDAASQAAFVTATELAARYPKDPRADMVRAMLHLEAENYVLAEGELRDALAAMPAVADEMPPYTEPYLHGVLAVTLLEEDRKSEAQAEARSLCAAPWPPHALAKLKDALAKADLCG